MNEQCAVGISFILLFYLSSDKQDSPLNLKIFCVIYSQGTHLADCHSSNIYLFARDFKSEKGLSSTEMSRTRASLAAESAAKFSLMSTWPGTQTEKKETKEASLNRLS